MNEILFQFCKFCPLRIRFNRRVLTCRFQSKGVNRRVSACGVQPTNVNRRLSICSFQPTAVNQRLSTRRLSAHHFQPATFKRITAAKWSWRADGDPELALDSSSKTKINSVTFKTRIFSRNKRIKSNWNPNLVELIELFDNH